MDNKTADQKEALKTLRKERREIAAKNALESKKQKEVVKQVKKHMAKEGGATVPEIAEQIDISASDVLYCIATLKKYGEVIEGEKDGSYFRYLPVAAD